MAFFLWNDDLSVGSTFIDNDHRRLIDLLNDLYNAVGEGRGPDLVGPVLNELVQYTQEHFKREEFVMRDMRYAEFSAHKREHENLTIKVLALRKRYADGETKLSVELLIFLYNWLFNHIMRVDKKLAQAIEEARSGSKSEG
jgi:hemerythrin-like metal-binding protein